MSLFSPKYRLLLLTLFWFSSAEKAAESLKDQPLKFLEHPPQYAVALPGDSVYLSCKTNQPSADESIRWLHNGTLLSSAGGRRLSIKLDQTRFERQLGEYRCVAGSADDGRFLASLPAQLSVARLGEFPPQLGAFASVIEAFEGNDVVMDCLPPDSNPPAFVQFYKDGLMVGADSSYEVLNGETLLIKNVGKIHEGMYGCSATNHISGQKKVSERRWRLRVTRPKHHEKSRLTYRPKERYQVQLGENLTIPCIASGNPKPEIIWTRVGNNQRLPSSNGCLKITDAEEGSSGSYMCAIFNGSRRFLRRTTVIVLTPPVLVKQPGSYEQEVSEGSPVWLHCRAEGTPTPSIHWFFNGQPVQQGHKTVLQNGTLHVPFARRDADVGTYQCFAVNAAGRNQSTALNLSVSPNASLTDEEVEFWHRPHLLDHLSPSPPSRPNVTQRGQDSALLTWSVSDNSLRGEVMPIQFFKIQFREFQRGRRSEWRTLDDEINARSRSFEVLGLRAGVKYRFRIVAVYANNDNQHGPLSKRFKLDKSASSDRAPGSAPVITQVVPLGPTSLRVGWRMDRVLRSEVEGYFIFIRRVSNNLDDFRKVTIIGHESHSFIFEALRPDTAYEIKASAFNFAGTSPDSRFVRRKTLPLPGEDDKPNSAESTIQEVKKSNSTAISHNVASEGDVMGEEDLVLYVSIAGVAGLAVLLLVIGCSLASCLQKRRARKTFSDTNVAIHQKYLDTSRTISMTVQGGRSQNYSNGEMTQISPSESQTVETSFSSPNRLSQMLHSASTIPVGEVNVDRNPNAANDVAATAAVDESFCSSITDLNGSRISLGYEEYTDEPSRTSWKRRRRSEEIL